jgi:uncharacterized damage-inducible protein DinB
MTLSYTPADTPLDSLFRYKAWANDELINVLSQADANRFPNEVRTATRIINHTYVVDCIFKAHLLGVKHDFVATNTPETPHVDELRKAINLVDSWYLEYVSRTSTMELSEVIHFRFTDGDMGSMSRQEIFLHVSLHGGYHRGAAGEILRSTGLAPPRDLYSRYLHSAEPTRRS